MSDRSLGLTLWNFFLALLNATLILVALCLWLGWGLATTVRDVSSEFARNLVDVAPVQDEIGRLRAEVEGLRSDIAELRVGGDAARIRLASTIESRVEGVEAQIGELAARADAVLTNREDLIADAIDHSAAAVAAAAKDVLSCAMERPEDV